MSTRSLVFFALPASVMLVAACANDVTDSSELFDPRLLASLEIVDEPATLLVSDTTRLTVVARDSAGTAVTPALTWATDNAAVAPVDRGGLVSGRLDGTTMIRVSAGMLSDSITLTVTEGIRFASLVTGADHTCGLDSSGAVYCWGSNRTWQLGVQTATTRCLITTQNPSGIACSPRPVIRVGGAIQFTAVSAGWSHTCGLDAGGLAYCWGDNAWTQLGVPFGATRRSDTPVPVSDGRRFREIEAGGDFSCGLTQIGSAYCWGTHGFGELGTGDLELFTSDAPVAVVGGHQFVQLVSGYSHSCGLTGSGSAYCWGENEIGSLGIGSVSPPGSWPAEPTPTRVAGGLTFSHLGAGTRYSCGLTTTGSALCWGFGLRGRLGNGSTLDRASPEPVLGALSWSSLSVGLEHVCALTTARELACWGNNDSGQLGVAPTGERCPANTSGPTMLHCSTRPVARPPTPRRFRSVVAGGVHTCALDDLGYAFCWGSNGVAQLGNGRVGGSSHVPSPVIKP